MIFFKFISRVGAGHSRGEPNGIEGQLRDPVTVPILPRLMGAGRALDLLWSSRKIDAQQAYEAGLVEYLTEDDALLATAQDYVRDLAANVSPASLRDTKRLVYDNLGIEYGPALRQAHALQEASLLRGDAVEGVQSFVERRPPNFDRLGDD